ncbi:hypothetical protein KUTeg_002347 [Tegillarca granosa]|uniref:peptidylprolyl isomerase n=1 Tax=Tegillarca granosa TaxID=220873 RepID=A0ABQ9FYF5_TEGGR|nr:hypothetical protein KUTeg_002347 [Tegillarca granosa]
MLCVWIYSVTGNPTAGATTENPAQSGAENTIVNTNEDYLPKLKVEVLKEPLGSCERKSKKSDLITLHYVGYFENGTKFDSSVDKQEAKPFSFQLGIGQVIKGWEQGLLDMCVGERRKLFVPSHLAYGGHGSGDIIPPNANLIFETELVQVVDGPKVPNVFKMIDINSDSHLSIDEMAMYLTRQAMGNGIPVDLAAKQNQKILQDLFKYEDKDKDGKISFDEFSGPKHDEL